MSADRRLEHELSRNLRDEEALIEHLEADRALQLQLFQNAQSQIELQSQSQNRADLSKHYLARDDAFFKQLHILQQLRSDVKYVTDYHQPVAMPKMKQSDVRIYSLLEKHNAKDSEYLADFEEFLRDKKAHEKEIERVNKLIIDIHAEIRAIIIPQILYYLLEWLPLIIQIYRYFAPVNSLDTAIKQGQILERELAGLEQDIKNEDHRFHKKWKEKYIEYSALSMNEKKLVQLRTEKTQFEKSLESHNRLEVYINSCQHAGIQQAYELFKTQPSYVNLFHVCSALCEQKFIAGKQASEINQVLDAINELYPEAQAELQQFAHTTLFNLNAGAIFDLLKDKYHRLIESSKKILKKAKVAIEKTENIADRISKLNPILDAVTIYYYQGTMQELNTNIENARRELIKRRKLIEPFKNFLNNRTGSNLNALYLFMSDPANQRENASFAELLKKLYPAALETMEAEQHGIISIRTNDIVNLQEKYLRQILFIEKSEDREMAPLKEVARALHRLLNTPNWTWQHFNTIEQAIRRNPQYALNPTLAGLFNRATQMVAESRQFQATIRTQRPAPSTQPLEILLNQSNPLPSFFQPPSSVSSVANALIKNIMEKINAHNIHTIDRTLASEEKQETIDFISDKMLQYIEMLSTDDGTQTISPQHLALLRDQANFIRLMKSPALPNHLNEENINHINTQLAQLAAEHPIRKGVEFLINLFRTKNEYIAIDTRYAQVQLRKDLNAKLKEFEASEQKESKKKHSGSETFTPENRMDLHYWSMALSLQNILKTYVANLEKFSSPRNATESIELKAVTSLAERLYDTLRYNSRKYGEIPLLLTQLEHQNNALGDHPAREAVTHIIHALKQTKDFAKVPVGAAGELGVKK
jgi:hypothetical protein